MLIRWVLLPLAMLSAFSGCKAHNDSLADETQRIEAWRVQRVTSLTSDGGWLTLAGLYWLKQGSNHVGLDAHNKLVLNQPEVHADVGTFKLQGDVVQFIAAPDSKVTVHGQAVTQLNLTTDATDKPTTLTLGSLRLFAIERAGQIGIRVRDTEQLARKNFQGLSYFPISTEWRVDARYEPYIPSKLIAIVNILGMTEQMESPGALVFSKDGHTWRLDALRESPTDSDLFLMFTDATSGRDTYGAGRYIYVPTPTGKQVWLDFNQAFNPPCAFTEYATCPLPPRQNRLQLAVTAGEKKYIAH